MTLIVKSSSLHGAGVYTTSPVKKGTRVLEYTGPRLTRKETDGMYADNEVTYLFTMDDNETVIDGFGMAAFVNHSCDPNCESDQIDKSIWIIALRDIGAGEELTYDYCLWDGEPGDEAPCYCGAANCRGTMYSEEEIERQKKLLRQQERKRAAKRKRRKSGKAAA
ncbi:MAG TPA: SET domain-containing protein-lysine N-methyltransferase [Candidatus Limnocylindrales bacterium]|nr:SET domain-containing protein-lysine N-methyltransferase [Candidatus Limnocylindrales bacterium]